MIKYGMILAAGLGKRMQPLTLKTPKPLLKINGKSINDWVDETEQLILNSKNGSLLK